MCNNQDESESGHNNHSGLQARIEELEKELLVKQTQLQETLEELETSNEELISTNEELFATNLELQNTNEKIQTVNAELYKVNSEHVHKIDELTELNADFDNLLRNTFIGDLFLDKNLIVRKINEVATNITKITSAEVGQSLRHLSLDSLYADFFRDIEGVATTQTTFEREVADSQGNWYLMRSVPYLTKENVMDGVLVSFIDVTHQKKIQMVADNLNVRLDNALRIGEMSWWEWDYETNEVHTGEGKYKMLGFEKEEIGEGYEWWMNRVHPDDYEPSMEAMRIHLKGEGNYFSEFRIKHKSGHYLWYRDKGGIVTRQADGKPKLLIGIVQNVSKEKYDEHKYQEALIRAKQQETEHTLLIQNLSQGVLLQDESGEILYANAATENIFGFSLNELKGKTLDNLGGKKLLKDDYTDLLSDSLPSLLAIKSGLTVENEIIGIYNPKRELYVWVKLSTFPLFKHNENFAYKAYTIFTEIEK